MKVVFHRKYTVILLAVFLAGCGDSTREVSCDRDSWDSGEEWDGGGEPEEEDGYDDGEVVDWEDGGLGDFEAGDLGADGAADGGDDYDDGGDMGDTGDTGDAGDTGDYGLANEVWIEIDYSGAWSPQSPGWSFSDTPGWGPAQWATKFETWPEVWDLGNNMQVIDDHIGRAVAIPFDGTLQLMLGFEELISYDSVKVRLEGRAYDCCAHADFNVYNPWTMVGTLADMAQDWTIHVVELDFDDTFFAVGADAGVQAVRVEPSNNSLSLVRMRVTIYNPVY